MTSALVGGEWSVTRFYYFTPGERTRDTHWIGGSMDPNAGLDDMKKRTFLAPLGIELRPLGRPASS
jgi:hypothetical protein